MKKKVYEEKLKSQLDEWNTKIDVLKAKASKAEAETKIEYHETLEDLKKKRAEAKDKLQKLSEAGDDAWEDMKEGIEAAWSSLGAAVKSATSRFK